MILISKLQSRKSLLKWALGLSLFTIFYNLIEGVVSVLFGLEGETLALLGFGTDSFVEVFSGLGIAHAVIRMHYTRVEEHDRFERTALRITGVSFFILAAGLLAGSTLNFLQGNQPTTTLPGVIIALISIVTMYVLVQMKMQTGKALNSDAVISDAQCTKSCFYLSFVLLGSSLLYELFAIPYIDIAGSLAIAVFAFREGREAFMKVRKNKFACACDDDHC